MKKVFILAFITCIVHWQNTVAQDENDTSENTVQPTIMVIPFVKEGDDIRKVIEDDPNKRISISAVKQGFDSRNYTTIDFIGKLKSMSRESAMAGENQVSIKQLIVENSGADIYVEVDYILTESESGSMVEIILQGYDAFSGQSLSNATGRSRIFKTYKLGILAEDATKECIEDFLNIMIQKFTNIVENGRTVTINITLGAESEYNMDSRVGAKSIPLKFAIRQWLKKKSYKGYYHLQGSTKTNISVDDFRIPIKNEYGENYQLDEFEFEVFTFFEDLGLAASTSIVGTSMQISID